MKKFFTETGIHIIGNSKRYLGAVLGTHDFVMNYVQEVPTAKLRLGNYLFIPDLCHMQPAIIYTWLAKQWTFLLRSIKGIDHSMQLMEGVIFLHLQPVITGREALTDHKRDLLALPELGT